MITKDNLKRKINLKTSFLFMLSRRIVRGVEPVALWDKPTCELRNRDPNFNEMVTKIWTHTGVGSSKNGKLTKVLHRNTLQIWKPF